MYNYKIKNKDIEYFHNIFIKNDKLKDLLIDNFNKKIFNRL